MVSPESRKAAPKISHELLVAMGRSMSGINAYLRDQFGMEGNISADKARMVGTCFLLDLEFGDHSITVVSVPPESRYNIGKINSQVELIQYFPNANRPAIIVDVRRKGVGRDNPDIVSQRQIGESLSLYPGASYSLRTRDEAATVIIKKTSPKK